jgi:membrane-associated protease RseP (regulator of RpoE activity)
MIGRLDSASKKIMVYGVGTSPPLVSILEGVRQTTGGHLKLITDSSGIGPSDHTSFYLKNIPVLHFFTGQHMDYHKPSDDTEKINVAGQEEVLRYIYLVLELVASEKSLVFTPTRNPKQETPSFKVTLGIMPDYTFEGPGVRIDAVTKGRPASNAGLNKGDIILGIGEIETTSMQAYMKALGKFSKGDKTKVSFLREGNRQMVDLQF